MRSGSSSSGWCLGAIADYAEAVRAPVSSVKAWRLRRMRLAFASGSRARVVSVLRYVDGPSFDRDFTLGTGRHGHADPPTSAHPTRPRVTPYPPTGGDPPYLMYSLLSICLI